LGRKEKVSYETKIEVISKCVSGKMGVNEISHQLNVSVYSVEEWLRKYKTYGFDGLKTKSKNKHYSAEVKLKAVTEYINGKDSLYGICARYKISSHSVLQNWIKQYNGHKIFKSNHNQGDKIMTNGRKTTYKERAEIVSFCITNANDYNLTANKYKVSYQQVYSWIKKYNENGYDALVDRRGKHKTLEELSESDKISLQIKILEAENRRLKMENDFLKKLEEIERR
jgi:transposase